MEKIINGLIQPNQILSQLDLRDNITVADFGCGNGHFSIPLAKAIPKGKIYALDVIKETLEAVKSQANLEGIENIITVHCNLEILGSSKLENDSVDLVLMRNILFQSQKKEEIIKEAKRVLKSEGQLILLEWIPGASMAPTSGFLITKEESQKLVEVEGMNFSKDLIVDNQHHGSVFKKT
ncbi:MAG: class I SAM-dependent methyltransferase [Patescibacteria group bacterium]